MRNKSRVLFAICVLLACLGGSVTVAQSTSSCHSGYCDRIHLDSDPFMPPFISGVGALTLIIGGYLGISWLIDQCKNHHYYSMVNERAKILTIESVTLFQHHLDDLEGIYSFINTYFCGNWPLVLAKNYIIEKRQQLKDSINKLSNAKTGLIDKGNFEHASTCIDLDLKARCLLEKLEKIMCIVTQNPDYNFQLQLYVIHEEEVRNRELQRSMHNDRMWEERRARWAFEENQRKMNAVINNCVCGSCDACHARQPQQCSFGTCGTCGTCRARQQQCTEQCIIAAPCGQPQQCTIIPQCAPKPSCFVQQDSCSAQTQCEYERMRREKRDLEKKHREAAEREKVRCEELQREKQKELDRQKRQYEKDELERRQRDEVKRREQEQQEKVDREKRQAAAETREQARIKKYNERMERAARAKLEQ